MRKLNSAAYNHAYYLGHREQLLAKRKAYNEAHAKDIIQGRKAYYHGRKVYKGVVVETLFDGEQSFIMRRGHRYLKKKQ